MDATMQVILFSLTLDCIIVIAFNLYVLELTDAFGLQTIVALVDTSFTTLWAFAYYYLSEWITADLLDIGDTVYHSPWYRLPAKQQRLVMLPIERAQQEFRLTGLGLFNCSLAVFSSVLLQFSLSSSNTMSWYSVSRIHSNGSWMGFIHFFLVRSSFERPALTLLWFGNLNELRMAKGHDNINSS